MTPLETLKAARDLISDPARWTQGIFARDKNNQCVDPQSDEAVCFCSYGAIERFTRCEGLTEVEAHIDAVCEKMSGMCTVQFNDIHTHAEVLALFDAAIAELEGANVA